jgi:glycine cleavage system H protein
MADDLIFMMGRHETRIPGDRSYMANHMWLRTQGETRLIGLTAFVVRLLRQVYFLDWSIEAPAPVQRGQEIGTIESAKAVGSLFAPFTGTITRFNETLLDDPGIIHADPYGNGWLFEMAGDPGSTLSPEDYINLLEDRWQATQCSLRRQMGPAPASPEDGRSRE